MDEREARLPAWARETLVDLRKRLAAQSEPLVREIAQLRPKIELMTRRNEALTELLECAAMGGHKTAKEIVDIISQYSLHLVKEDDPCS